MSNTALAVAGLIAWHLVLTLIIVNQRGLLTFFGGRAANSFGVDGKDVSEFSNRVCRAHANSYESFPWTAGTLFLALVLNQAAVTDGLALYMLYARVGQSVVHLASTSAGAVLVRFGFFFVQMIVAALCLYKLVCQ